jgi:hypothetical protein
MGPATLGVTWELFAKLGPFPWDHFPPRPHVVKIGKPGAMTGMAAARHKHADPLRRTAEETPHAMKECKFATTAGISPRSAAAADGSVFATGKQWLAPCPSPLSLILEFGRYLLYS